MLLMCVYSQVDVGSLGQDLIERLGHDCRRYNRVS